MSKFCVVPGALCSKFDLYLTENCLNFEENCDLGSKLGSVSQLSKFGLILSKLCLNFAQFFV
jgi:hypothetical protein